MKKILLLLAILPFFYSCSSHDHEYTLSGTTWESVYQEPGYFVLDAFSFQWDTFAYYYEERYDGSIYTETHHGTYYYNPPYLYLRMGDYLYEGIVIGDEMIVEGLYDQPISFFLR